MGLFSGISLIETISPVVFLNFLSCLRKYQKRDLATIGSGEKILILYKGGLGSFSDGSLRPITSYSLNCPLAFIFGGQQQEEKTIVYVLSKKPEEVQDILVPKIEQKPPSKPEVFFVKYKNKEDSQAVINNIVNDYNKEQSVSFSGLDDSPQNVFGSGAQTILDSGSNFGSGSLGVFGVSSPSPIPLGHYTEQLSDSPVEIPASVGSFGTQTVAVNQPSGSDSFSAHPSLSLSDSSVLSNSPISSISSVSSVPESSTAISGSGTVSSTPSSLLLDDVNTIPTSQGVPHETYGPPKFRAN